VTRPAGRFIDDEEPVKPGLFLSGHGQQPGVKAIRSATVCRK
jgi:hypothetical protein